MARPQGCFCINNEDGRVEIKSINACIWYLKDAISANDKCKIYNEILDGAAGWHYVDCLFEKHPEWIYKSSLQRMRRIYIKVLEQAVNTLCGEGSWLKTRGFFYLSGSPGRKVWAKWYS